MTVFPRWLLFVVAIAGLPVLASAQYHAGAVPYESDILDARPVRYFVAGAVGGSAAQHLGSYSPACDCYFSGERTIGLTYGGEIGIQYPKLAFAIKTLVLYRDYSADFTRTGRRRATVIGGSGDEELDFRNTSNVHLQSLSIIPMLALYLPPSEFFLLGGIDIGVMLEARYNHLEDILTPGYTYYDGSTRNTLKADSDIPGGKRLRVALTGGLGVDVFLSERILLTPEAGISYPLTGVSTGAKDSDWKVMSEFAILLLKVRL